MKKSFILLPIVGFLSYVVLSSYSSGPASLGSLERTGITGTTGCSGAGCHGSSAGITLVVELLSGSTTVTSYTPGASYTLRLKGTYALSSTTPPTLSSFGFQVGCVKTTTVANAGTWGTPPAGTHAATAGSPSINLIEQGSPLPVTTGAGAPGSTYVVNIPWTAPVAGTGSVTFKGVLNAVNGGSTGADANDRWNSGSVTITEATSAGPGPISGTLTVCVGATTTLTDATPGGTWTSSTTAVATVGSSTGIVTGVTPGTATITYSTGSGTPATAVVTVNAAPTPVTGTPTVCVGATTTLASTPAGGSWSTSTPSVATVVSTSGVVSGVSVGTATITYTGLNSCYVTKQVTVNAAGAAPIAGSHTVCVGTTTTLTNLTTGGTWTSSVPAKATVGSATGIVTGVAVGTTMISYTATNSCGSSTVTHSINVLVATACTGGVNPTTTTESYLSVFPNPSNGTFTMNMVSGISETANVRVVNLSGQVVKEFTATTNAALEVNIPHTTGMYFVMVNTPSGNYVSKLIVQ